MLGYRTLSYRSLDYLVCKASVGSFKLQCGGLSFIFSTNLSVLLRNFIEMLPGTCMKGVG